MAVRLRRKLAPFARRLDDDGVNRDSDRLHRVLARGELVRLVYRLGRHEASGVLTFAARSLARSRAETFVLRRGHAIVSDGDLQKKLLISRLVRLAGQEDLVATFEGGAAPYPPGAQHQVDLARWAREHLEAQVDSALADNLVRQLSGMRLAMRQELAPRAVDEADRRMMTAMGQPRRLDQIWPLARTPRFRLLSFLHFLRAVDALAVEGVVAEASGPHYTIDARRAAALRMLGVDTSADLDTVKRAYRRIARTLHPDLQPQADDLHRRELERKFAEVTAAYETLL